MRDLIKRIEALVTDQNQLSGMREAILDFSLKSSLPSNRSQNSQKDASANPQLWQIIFSGCFKPQKLAIKQQRIISIGAWSFEFNLCFSSFLHIVRHVFYFLFRNLGKHVPDAITYNPHVLHTVKLTGSDACNTGTASSLSSSVSSSQGTGIGCWEFSMS